MLIINKSNLKEIFEPRPIKHDISLHDYGFTNFHYDPEEFIVNLAFNKTTIKAKDVKYVKIDNTTIWGSISHGISDWFCTTIEDWKKYEEKYDLILGLNKNKIELPKGIVLNLTDDSFVAFFQFLSGFDLYIVCDEIEFNRIKK